MQGLVETPRTQLTATQVMDVLQNAPSITVDYGADILDSNDNVIGDLTPNMQPGVITFDCNAVVNGSLQFDCDIALAWGAVRVKPYVLVSSQMNPKIRFDLGVYVLTTPEQDLSYDQLDQTKYSVTGYDKLYILNQPIGDSLTVYAGDNVLGAISAIILLAGGGSNLFLDLTANSAVLGATQIFPLTSQTSGFTWLQAINQLLATINYTALWVDQLGRYRAAPYVLPSLRAVEFKFDSTDPLYSLVAQQNRSVVNDQWNIPNHWVFVMNNYISTPVIGSGMYVVDNLTTGLSSQASVGRKVNKVVFLDAVDQPTLVALGNAQVASDMNQIEAYTLTTGPIWIAGYFDIVQYFDPKISGGVRKLIAQSWSLNMNGSDMTWNLNAVAGA